MSGYAAQDLIKFLNYALDKGLGKKETLKTRLVSVGRIVDVVGDDQMQDVRSIDVDHIMQRFMNLEGTKFSPGSLASYKSRLNSSIADFLRYKENPTSYKPARQRATRTNSSQSGSGIVKKDTLQDLTDTVSRGEERAGTIGGSIFPIPLRDGLTVCISDLPYDLTQSEARRIANVVMAMAVIEE